MFKVMRKETLHKYTDMREIKSENLNFVILDRYSFYQVAVEH